MRACLGLLTSISRSVSQGQPTTRTFPKEAVLHCRSGLTGLRGNLPDQARGSLLRALSLNPMIWEAFEGLCNLGETVHRILAPALVHVHFALQDPYQRSKNYSLHALRQLSALPQMNSTRRPRQHTLHALPPPEWVSSHPTMATPETCSGDQSRSMPCPSAWDD
jgi:hypothetical protein